MNPIEVQFSPGKVVYCTIEHPDGRYLNNSTLVWEALGTWANYLFPETAGGGGAVYRRAFPDIVLDVLPTEWHYQQMGVAPVIPSDSQFGDTPIGSSQSQGSDLFAINASVPAAARLGLSANTMRSATVVTDAGNSTTQVKTTLTDPNQVYRGRVVIFTSGNQAPSAGIVTGFTNSTGILTFTAIPGVPLNGDGLIIV